MADGRANISDAAHQNGELIHAWAPHQRHGNPICRIRMARELRMPTL
jgi:hypothetical protein